MLIASFVLFSLLFCVSIHSQETEIYATTTLFRGSTEVVVSTVQVFSNGSYNYLFDDIQYLGPAASYLGISAFDQKNKVFYFATNYLSSFVYVADVANKKLLAPIVTGLTFVNNINWDPSTNSIFIDGYFQSEDNSKYYTIFQYNTLDGSLRSIATFTNQVLVESTVDWKNGLYYFTDSSSLYTLQISNGFNITTAPVNCSDANTSYFIGYLYYDNVNLQLIGAGRDTNSILSYGYFTLSSKGSCKVTLLDLPQGVVLSHAFDPVNQNLYLGYAGPIALFTCDVKSGNLTQLDLSIYLNDVAVTFKV